MTAPTIPTALNHAAKCRGIAEVLDSAERFGLPMPSSLDVGSYRPPSLMFLDPDSWLAWAKYLCNDAPVTVEVRQHAGMDRLYLAGQDWDFDLTCVVIVAEGEGARLAALVEAAKAPQPETHAERAEVGS